MTCRRRKSPKSGISGRLANPKGDVLRAKSGRLVRRLNIRCGGGPPKLVAPITPQRLCSPIEAPDMTGAFEEIARGSDADRFYAPRQALAGKLNL
jgi:hypothetical protein